MEEGRVGDKLIIRERETGPRCLKWLNAHMCRHQKDVRKVPRAFHVLENHRGKVLYGILLSVYRGSEISNLSSLIKTV